MTTISKDELKEIIARHALWLRRDGGECANLSGADLSYADLSYADLSYANLSYANLSYANLSYANLSYADLGGADLSYANLSYANLSGADLSGADLSYADLSYANLSYANLSYANLSYADLSGADLSGAVGGNYRVQCLQVYPYKIIMLDNKTVWGGCTKKTAKQWLKYTGKELSESDRKYLETVTKPFIRMCLEMNHEPS